MNKLYIPLLASMLVGSSAAAQHGSNMRTDTRKADHGMMRQSPRETQVGIDRDIIWSNDFSNAADWVASTELTTDMTTVDADTWVVGTQPPSGPFAIDTIQSTTAANGFALFDSDLGCGGKQNAILAMANSVDLSAYSGVLLRFEQYTARWRGDYYIGVSTDGGSSWEDMEVLLDVPITATTAPNTMSNPEVREVNISALAGGHSDVKIRFRYYSCNTVHAADAGCDYAWQIDDLAFTTLPDYEVQMNYAYNSTTGQGEEYGRIPRSQLPAALNVGAEIFNLGLSTLGDAAVQVEYKDASGTVVPGLSTTIALAPIVSEDTVVADANVTFPTDLANGVYRGTFSILGDNIALDHDTTNNKQERNFEITENIYSVDAIGNYPVGAEALLQLGTATWEDNSSVYYMNMYDINTPTYATAITVRLAPATVAGSAATIEAMLFDTASITVLPSSIATPIQGIVSDLHTITAADITAGFVTLNLDPVQLQPGAYFAAVKLSGSGTISSTNSTDPEVYILDDNTVPQPQWTSAMYLPFDVNEDGTDGRHSYTNGNAYAIRLTLTPNVSVADADELTGISIFPNPSNGIFQINSDRSEVLFVEIADVTGKIVRTTKLSNMATVDLSDVATGVYTVTVSSATARTVQRVTVK